MGRVYLGRSPGGRQVAIKVIRAELAEDAEFRARFAREVSAARKVSGMYTAPVVDADLDAPVPWLATSYVAGPSLADGVAGRGPLPPASVLRLAAGLAEGLNAIHSAGVVHRDLKPSNVLLAEDGPLLIDFGICRSVETRVLTRTGMVVGSPGFMSPEQAEGHEVGPPSDIFNLGAVLAFADGRGRVRTGVHCGAVVPGGLRRAAYRWAPRGDPVPDRALPGKRSTVPADSGSVPGRVERRPARGSPTDGTGQRRASWAWPRRPSAG
jgi:serine/threonine protein kinase